MTMTHRERLLATIRGDTPDRPAAALWRHFPEEDLTAQGLADAVVAFQRAYEFDLVKVTPASGYPAEAWGATLENADNEEGTRRYTRRVVAAPADWAAIEPLDMSVPVFQRELEALRRVREGVGPDVHVFQTVFSPLTVAKQMVGATVLEELRTRPEALDPALAAVAETSARFAEECLANGADGVFFATQFARRDLMTVAEYEQFGVAGDKVVVDAVRDAGGLLLLHLCGAEVMFELAARYDADIVNWHARTTPPTMAEGLRSLPRGAVLGGLDRRGALASGSANDVAAAVRVTLSETGGKRTIVGAGCVTLVPTPAANIAAVRDAVRGAP